MEFFGCKMTSFPGFFWGFQRFIVRDFLHQATHLGLTAMGHVLLFFAIWVIQQPRHGRFLSSQVSTGPPTRRSVVDNHGDRLRPPKDGFFFLLPNGRVFACKWGVILTTYVGHGMIVQVMACICHVSNVQNPYDIPLYWLVFRDPQNGLLYSLCNCVVYPLYTLNSPGFSLRTFIWHEDILILTCGLLFTTYACTCAYTYANIYTGTWLHIYIYIVEYTLTHTRTHTHTYTYTCGRTCTLYLHL